MTSIELDGMTPELPSPAEPQLESQERTKAKIFFSKHVDIKSPLKRAESTLKKLNIDTGVIKLLKRKNGFIAKLTEKEIEELEALKRIRRVKHKPFSPDNTEDNTLAGVFSFEVSEESDEAIEVGLPSFEDEMDHCGRP